MDERCWHPRPGPMAVSSPLWPLRPPPWLDPKGEKVLLLAGDGTSPGGRCPWPWDPETRKAGRLHLPGQGSWTLGAAPGGAILDAQGCLGTLHFTRLGLEARATLGPGAWQGLSQDLGHGSAGPAHPHIVGSTWGGGPHPHPTEHSGRGPTRTAAPPPSAGFCSPSLTRE